AFLSSAAALGIAGLAPAPASFATPDADRHTPSPRPVLLNDSNYSPLPVWSQNPTNTARYKAAGINLYVALWRGPTDQQLALLKEQGMYVICSQNEAGLAHKDDPTIV